MAQRNRDRRLSAPAVPFTLLCECQAPTPCLPACLCKGISHNEYFTQGPWNNKTFLNGILQSSIKGSIASSVINNGSKKKVSKGSYCCCTNKECVKEKTDTLNGEVPSFAPTPSTTTLTTTKASFSQGGSAGVVSPREGVTPDYPQDRPSSLLASAGKWPDPSDAASSTCGGRRWLLCVSTNNAPPGEQYQPFSAPATPSSAGGSMTPVCSAPRTLPSCSLTGCFLRPSLPEGLDGSPSSQLSQDQPSPIHSKSPNFSNGNALPGESITPCTEA